MSLFFSSHTGLAVIGCSVLEKSIYVVLQEIESIRPKLNIPSNPSVKNISPVKAKEYLEKHSFQFCVLVVDGKTIKDTYENPSQRKNEYEDLLKTAVERVGKIIRKSAHCSIKEISTSSKGGKF